MTDELERALREGGEKVADGRFKVDSRRALAKLKDYRFADPAHWVLEVLRAASASGARTVSVRTDADDVELHFDGRPFRAGLSSAINTSGWNVAGDRRSRPPAGAARSSPDAPTSPRTSREGRSRPETRRRASVR